MLHDHSLRRHVGRSRDQAGNLERPDGEPHGREGAELDGDQAEAVGEESAGRDRRDIRQQSRMEAAETRQR